MNFITMLQIVLMSYCILGVFCEHFWVGKRQNTSQVIFERFDNTCHDRNVFIIFNHGGMRSENGKLLLNSTITVKKDVNMNLTTVIFIERCKNKENLDTCERFPNHKVDDYCEMIESKDKFWGPLFSSYQPEFKCPIKKGVYRSVNSTLDVSAMLLFPIDAWYWKIKVEVRDKATNRIVTCMVVETKVEAESLSHK